MSSNLFARFIERIKRPGFLISRLILISLAIILFSTSCWEEEKNFIEEKNKTCLSVEGKPDKDVELYWEEFKKARSQETFAIHWHPENRTPEAIFGKLDKLDSIAEKNIREWLLQNKALFKINNLDDLVLARNFETPIGKHFVFEQKNKIVGDKVVEGGQIAVHLNYDAEIIAINNTYVHGFNPNSINIKVKQEVALEFAKLILKAKKFVDKVKQFVDLDKIQINEDDIKLKVYFFNEEIKVAWRFVISTPNNTWEVFIDTQNKKGLGTPRDINKYFAESNAKVFNINPMVALCNFDLDPGNIPEEAYKTIILKGLEGKGYLDGEYASSANTKNRVHRSDNNFYFEKHDKEGFLETMVYYYVDYTQRYIQELGFSNIVKFDNKKNKKPIVYDANNAINSTSFYDTSNKTLLFGAKGYPDAKDAEIVIHEYAHAIQDYQIPGFGPGKEAAAIGEGFGDYLAASIGARFNSNCSDSDTCVGEWRGSRTVEIQDRCRRDTNCLRRLDTNKIYPSNYVCNTHCDGEIWSSALWQIRESVRNINVDDANKVILQSHFLITSTASFNQAANAIVTAAINLKKQGKIDQRINIENIKKCFTDKCIIDKCE